jgi:hypothetical protein
MASERTPISSNRPQRQLKSLATQLLGDLRASQQPVTRNTELATLLYALHLLQTPTPSINGLEQLRDASVNAGIQTNLCDEIEKLLDEGGSNGDKDVLEVFWRSWEIDDEQRASGDPFLKIAKWQS